MNKTTNRPTNLIPQNLHYRTKPTEEKNKNHSIIKVSCHTPEYAVVNLFYKALGNAYRQKNKGKAQSTQEVNLEKGFPKGNALVIFLWVTFLSIT